MPAGKRVDELRIDPQAVAVALDAAFENCLNPELLADLPKIVSLPSELIS